MRFVTVNSYKEINVMDLKIYTEHVNTYGWQNAEILALNPAVHGSHLSWKVLGEQNEELEKTRIFYRCIGVLLSRLCWKNQWQTYTFFSRLCAAASRLVCFRKTQKEPFLESMEQIPANNFYTNEMMYQKKREIYLVWSRSQNSLRVFRCTQVRRQITWFISCKSKRMWAECSNK